MPQPPQRDPGPGHAASERGDVLQGLLTLLPAALLLGGVLYGVPTHTSAGAGWVLLASLPALGAALARRAPGLPLARGGLALFGIVLALTLASRFADPDQLDPFEARRARVTMTAWLALLLSGASLGAAGRRVLTRGLALLALAGVATAWIDTALDPVRAFAGTLENSGDLSETTLAGAVLGLALASHERGAWRLAGISCAVLYLFTVGRVPVLAGALSFVVAAGLAAVPRHGLDRKLLVAGVLALAAGQVANRWPEDAQAARDAGATVAPQANADTGSDTAAEPSPVSASFGGVAFRRLTWPRVARMALAGGPLGAGAGQFVRAFPPYRDPREIELSSHGRRSPTSTEVEHAHNDWLQPLADHGALGLAWLALGLVLAGRCLAALRGAPGEPAESGESAAARTGIAAAGLGLLVNAAFNSPFFEGPAFAVAAPLFGCLLAVPAAGPRASVARAIALVLAALQVPAALGFVRHGQALAPLARAASTTVADGSVVHRLEAKRAAVDAALAACPDSVVARVENAHLARVESAPAADQLGLWQDILRSRPYHFEALLSAANLCARLERFDEASELYARAGALDPTNPTLIRNRLLRALRAGDVESVLDLLADESAREALDDAWLERSAAELLLSGRPHLGLPLLVRSNPDLEVQSAEASYALSQTVDVELLASALRAHAHFTWAREHALAGDPASAARSYRQALAVADRYPDLVGNARRVRLELAAALSLRGQREEAEALAGSLEPSPVDLAELPTWAHEELAARGWIDRGRR